jgi:hypothetical protein
MLKKTDGKDKYNEQLRWARSSIDVWAMRNTLPRNGVLRIDKLVTLQDGE